MSEEEKQTSGQTPNGGAEGETQESETKEDQSKGSESQEQELKDSVKYETYRKAISDIKKEKQRREELERKLQEKEQSELEKEGQKDEALKKLKEQLEEKDKKLNETYQNFANRVIGDQIKAKAQEKGCIAPEDAYRLGDWESVTETLNENFELDGNELERSVNDLMEKKPWLFQKQAKPPKDEPPKPGSQPTEAKKDPSEMSISELKQALRKQEGAS